MKVVAMRESKDLSKISTFELFSDLKAFEFDIDRRKDKETPSSKITALVASTAESSQVVDPDSEQDELALFIKQFRKFVKGGKSYMKKSSSKLTAEGKDSKALKGNNSNSYLCYNYRKPRHFIKDCPYPESKIYTEEERTARAERKRNLEKERIRALLSEFEKTKEASPSSSKQPVESDSEDSTDLENNEALICLMAKKEEDSHDETIHSLLLLIEDVKAIKSDNEALREENILLKESNEQLLEEATSNLAKFKEAEEKYLYLNLSHKDLFTEASCRIADCIEFKRENEALTKKLNETEIREKCWLKKLDCFSKSSRQLKEMLEQQRPAGDLTGINYNP
ncbi:hypothetical protein ACS0TY_030559 [Phlomoides rotata]